LLPLLVLLVPLVSVGGAVAWARAAAQAERRSRITARPARQTQSRQPSSPSIAVEADREAALEAVGEAAAVAEVDPEIAARPLKPELFDVQAEPARVAAAAPAPAVATPAAVRAPARPLVDEDDIPLTWDPVPVPRPTYTMKSRVTRPAPTSADLVGDADTEYAAYEELPERRVAGA
jgi:hypothetical protein